MSNLPFNIMVPPDPATYGSSVTKGLRIGASASEEGSAPPASGVHSPLLSPARLNLDQWGPGVYTGGLFTYRIIPTPVSEKVDIEPSNRNQDNVVKEIDITETNLGTFLPLAAYTAESPRASQTYQNQFGETQIMFDYPRCLAVYSSVSQTATLSITAWGFDLYGQKMMETISFGDSSRADFGSKAFQGIYKIRLNSEYSGSFVSGEYFAVGTSNIFGLPFSLSQSCHMIGYSQGDIRLQSEVPASYWKEASATFPQLKGGLEVENPDNQLSLVFLPYQFGLPDFVNGADTSTPSATTGDVRGVFKPGNGFSWTTFANNSPYNFNTAQETLNNWPLAPQPWATFTYYIAGADMYQNTIDAQIKNWQTFALDPSVFSGMWKSFYDNVPARNQNSMKGLPQYWEDIPNA